MERTEYKGCIIEPESTGYAGKEAVEWYHPDYVDCDWTGDGWQSSGCGISSNIEQAKEDIDDFLVSLNRA